MFQRKLVEMFLKLRLVPCENLDIDLAFESQFNRDINKLPPWILFLDKVRFKYIIPNILFLTVIQHILEKHSSDISVTRFDLMLIF